MPALDFRTGQSMGGGEPRLLCGGAPLLIAYLMPPSLDEFANFINQWLDLQRASGFEQRMTE